MIFRICVAIALACSLGCVSAPVRQTPDIDVEVPERWDRGPAPSTEPTSDWWGSFGDPNLDSLIRTALEENRDLRAAAARLDQAAARARIAGAELKPTIGVGVGGSRGRQNFIGLPIPGSGEVLSSTSTSYGVSLDTTWEVDLWGRLRAGARAALAEFQADRAALRGAELSVAAQTAKAWFNIVELRQQLTLAEDSAKSFRRSAAQVRSRFEQGLRPALDLRLALSNLAGAEALTHLRRSQLDGSIRQLELLLGRYPSGRLLDELEIGLLPDALERVPVGLPAELIARRPDLVAAERRLAAADQIYLQARRSLYPRLSLTAGGGTTSASLSDLLDGDFRVWSLVGNLTQPLFQGGRLRAGVDAADAGSRAALDEYASQVLAAFAEVESALSSESDLALREQSLAEAATQLTAARRLAEDRYRNGVGIYLAVLESQSRALDAESRLLDVRRQRVDNRINLHLALGGSFETTDRADERDLPEDDS